MPHDKAILSMDKKHLGQFPPFTCYGQYTTLIFMNAIVNTQHIQAFFPCTFKNLCNFLVSNHDNLESDMIHNVATLTVDSECRILSRCRI